MNIRRQRIKYTTKKGVYNYISRFWICSKITIGKKGVKETNQIILSIMELNGNLLPPWGGDDEKSEIFHRRGKLFT